MIDKLIQLSVMSGGLLPLMGVLLLITLAVIVERSYFFFKVLNSGEAMEHDLQLVEYQNWEKLEQLATHYDGSLQRSIITSTALERSPLPSVSTSVGSRGSVSVRYWRKICLADFSFATKNFPSSQN